MRIAAKYARTHARVLGQSPRTAPPGAGACRRPEGGLERSRSLSGLRGMVMSMKTARLSVTGFGLALILAGCGSSGSSGTGGSTGNGGSSSSGGTNGSGHGGSGNATGGATGTGGSGSGTGGATGNGGAGSGTGGATGAGGSGSGTGG